MSTKLWKEISISTVTMVITMQQSILTSLRMLPFMSQFISSQLMLKLKMPSILALNII